MNDLQIEYFLEVSNSLSFSKAAKNLRVSQPAVSKQVAGLEGELGTPLFKRGSKLLKLTEAGHIYRDHFVRQREDLSNVKKIALKTVAQDWDPLVIGFGWGWTLDNYLADLLRYLQARNDRFQFIIECYEFPHLPRALVDEQVDVILGFSNEIPLLGSLSSHHLTSVPRVLIYSKERFPPGSKPFQPQDFKEELFIVPTSDNEMYVGNLVKSYCKPYGFMPKVQMVGSKDAVIANVANGLGVSVVDYWSIERLPGRVGFVRLNSEHSISVAWKNENRHEALNPFVNQLRDCFAGGVPPAI